MKHQSDSPTVRQSVLIGVDAGGSHTAVAIANGSLHVLARAEGPGAAMRPDGGTRSAAVIAEVVRDAAGRAGVTLPADRLVVGAAGAGREPEREQLVAALLACGLAGEVRALGDAEAALTAAFQDGPGILVSAGTGSIAYARDAHGAVHRSGGYGWQMSDEGGGYWLGRRALETAGRAVDAREEGSTLLTRLLAALGIYGVMALSTTQRTREMGIRFALGASRADVLRLVLGKGISLIGVGLLAGFLGALAASRALSSLLYNVGAIDAGAVMTAVISLLAVALIACCVPARRATRVDPIVALRTE